MDRRVLSITVALILFLGVLFTAHPASPKVIATARPGITETAGQWMADNG